jgi:hypothetical protein
VTDRPSAELSVPPGILLLVGLAFRRHADSSTTASRPSGEWSDDDYDVLADGVVVALITRAAADALEATPWFRTLAFGHHEDRTPMHGYEARCLVAVRDI